MNSKNESPEEAYRKHRERTPLINLNTKVHPVIDDFIEQQNYYNELFSRSDRHLENVKNGLGRILKETPSVQLIMLKSFYAESEKIKLDLEVLRPNYTNAYDAFHTVAKQDEDVMHEFRKLSPWLVIEDNKKSIEKLQSNHTSLMSSLEPQIQKVAQGEDESKANPRSLQNAHPCIATFFKHHQHFLKTMKQHNQHVLRWDREVIQWKTVDDQIKGITAYLHDTKNIYADVKSVLANYSSSYHAFRNEGKRNPRVMHEFRILEKSLPADGMKNIIAQWEQIKVGYEQSIKKREENIEQLKELKKRNTTPLPSDLTNLKKIDLSNNQLDEESVNGLLLTVNSYGTYDGEIRLDGGTNAPPSGQAIIAINELRARGWTVVTN